MWSTPTDTVGGALDAGPVSSNISLMMFCLSFSTPLRHPNTESPQRHFTRGAMGRLDSAGEAFCNTLFHIRHTYMYYIFMMRAGCNPCKLL